MLPLCSSCAYSRDVIKSLLARVGKTSSGNDDIPYWMFRDCPSAIAGVVAKILNFSLTTGVAQGSGIGPCLYIMILNLNARAATNHMAKYADDSTLLIPELTSLNIEEEVLCVQKWACDNKLSINLSKTKEIVFHRPNARSIILPSPLQNIERVTSTKLLDVYISHDLAANAQTE